jgi:hypothetical protein
MFWFPLSFAKNCIKLCDPIPTMFVFKAVKFSCEHPVHLVEVFHMGCEKKIMRKSSCMASRKVGFSVGQDDYK